MHFKLWKIVLLRFDIYYYISISRVLLFHAYATDFDARLNAYWYSLFSSSSNVSIRTFKYFSNWTGNKNSLITHRKYLLQKKVKDTQCALKINSYWSNAVEQKNYLKKWRHNLSIVKKKIIEEIDAITQKYLESLSLQRDDEFSNSSSRLRSVYKWKIFPVKTFSKISLKSTLELFVQGLQNSSPC